MFEAEVKIPKERVAVLIGKKGETKKLLQRMTKTSLAVTKEGDVIITAKDTLQTYLTTPIVKAVGRGFNPEIALQLLKEDNALEVINMQDIFGKSQKKLTRMKARLIGTKGKARRFLEKLTNTALSVYGKTVAIIGKTPNVFIAKQAVEKLLKGSPHGNVYKFIEDQYKKLKEQEN